MWVFEASKSRKSVINNLKYQHYDMLTQTLKSTQTHLYFEFYNECVILIFGGTKPRLNPSLVSDDSVMFDSVSSATPLDNSGASAVCKFISRGPLVTLDPAMMSPPQALLLLRPVACYQGPSCFPFRQHTWCYPVTRMTSCPACSGTHPSVFFSNR